MTPAQPPSLAVWLLQRFACGLSSDALIGDLLEEFHRGRSRRWFWGQAFHALAIDSFKWLRMNGPQVIFAGLWSILAPGWIILVDRFEQRGDFIGHVWRIDWPWSTICAFSLWTSLNMIFLWVGLLFCITMSALSRNRQRTWRLGRGALASVAMFNAIYVGLYILVIFTANPTAGVDSRLLTPLHEIADFSTWALIERIPYLLTLLCTLWAATPRSKARFKRTTL